ncbi:hypothetical protein [Symbioplanes lichenis]|uniref:hypothetical protein n=1 Tax=Symbioplanes lichenis TaxID=1629072 RepID=UPI0027382BF3|nr:hypothetical protein [Actinoplanes lichenis]
MPYWRISAVAAGLVAVALATGGTGPAPEGTIELASRGTPASHGGTFSVRARPVTGLFPGVVKPMVVTLRNPYDFDLRVTTIGGKVTDSSKRSCRPGTRTVSARPYAGRLPVVVPARSTREVGAVPIAMAADAPERCRRTTFEVLLTGRATKAGR